MDKLINDFSFGFILADSNICWINLLLKKFAWKPILDAVNDRRRN
jgi:F-type H+-transporting ATPase subunit b